MLTDLQRRVAEIIGALPEAASLALGGGAALIARGIVNRSTRDLDYFTPIVDDVLGMMPHVARALQGNGLTVGIIQADPGFARLEVVSGDEHCAVDLVADYRAFPPERSPYGPMLAAQDLAAGKVLALFGRAEIRDFGDVFVLARTYGKEQLLEWAASRDLGFDRQVLAEMLGMLRRYTPEDLDVDDQAFADLTAFFQEWREELVGRN